MLVIQLKHPPTCIHTHTHTVYTVKTHKSGVYFFLKCHLERIGRASTGGSTAKKEENHTHHFSTFFNNILVSVYVHRGTHEHRIHNIIVIKAENILLPFNKTVEKYE